MQAVLIVLLYYLSDLEQDSSLLKDRVACMEECSDYGLLLGGHGVYVTELTSVEDRLEGRVDGSPPREGVTILLH